MPVVCPNCGRQAEHYCPHCGQKQHGGHPTIRGLVHELIQETFSLEGRVFSTLRSVVTQPGELALDFLEGRRARHVSPLKLFLIVFALFFLLSADLIDMAQNAMPLYGEMAREHAAARGMSIDRYLDTLRGPVLAGTKAMRGGLLVVNSVWYWLLFRRSRRPFIDHVVLSLQLGCFSLSVGILASLVILATGSTAASFLLATPASVAYAALAAHRFYGESWPSTVAKAVLVYLLNITTGSVVLLAWTGLVIWFY